MDHEAVVKQALRNGFHLDIFGFSRMVTLSETHLSAMAFAMLKNPSSVVAADCSTMASKLMVEHLVQNGTHSVVMIDLVSD